MLRLHRLFFWGICILFSGCGSKFRREHDSFSADQSSVNFDLCEGLDFGDCQPGEVVQRSFRMSNPTERPIDFTIESGCGCLSVSPRSGVIDSKLTVQVDLAMSISERGTSKASVLRVITGRNSGNEHVKNIQALIRSQALIELGTRHVQLGRTKPGQSLSVDLPVIRTLIPLDEIELRSDPDRIRTATINRDQNGQPRLWIATRDDLPIASYTTMIRFVSRKAPTIEGTLGVSFEVCTRYRSSPSIIDARSDALERGVNLFVTRSDGECVEPLLAKTIPHLRIEDLGGEMPTFRRLLKLTAEPGFDSKNLNLWFGSDPESLTVTIRPLAAP